MSKTRMHQSQLAFSSTLLDDCEQGVLHWQQTVNAGSGQAIPEVLVPNASYRRPYET
jgi:hypothetical protein